MPDMRVLVRSLLFVFVAPGVLAFVGPRLVAGLRTKYTVDFGMIGYAAIPLWAVAVAILIACAWQFARQARCSPAHFEQPRGLMTAGIYAYLRNPMYVAQLLAVLAAYLWWGKPLLLIYLAIYALCVWLVARFYEAALLERLFPREYPAYARAVPAWYPRLTPYEPAKRAGDGLTGGRAGRSGSAPGRRRGPSAA